MSSILKAYRNTINYNGRAPLKEYWLFQLFHIVVLAIGISVYFLYLDMLPFGDYIGIGLLVLNALLFSFPNISLSVRRLHDCGKSGGFYFLYFIGWFGVFIVMCMCAGRGQLGTNRYGDNPYGYPSEQEVIQMLISHINQWLLENPNTEIELVNDLKLDLKAIIKYDRRNKIKSPLIDDMVFLGTLLGYPLA